MGARLCCADTRDLSPDSEMKRFDTFGCMDTPPVPNVMDALTQRESLINLEDVSYHKVLDNSILRSDNEGRVYRSYNYNM